MSPYWYNYYYILLCHGVSIILFFVGIATNRCMQYTIYPKKRTGEKGRATGAVLAASHAKYSTRVDRNVA